MVSGPILIVGEAQRCIPLVRRVVGLGYPVEACGLPELTGRVREGNGPAAVMLCAEGPAASAVMQELRSMRRGVSIPVTLCGRLGGAIRDLADVLDLGADQFLEEPFEDATLASTLTALAGAPPAPPPEPDSASTAVSADQPLRTEVLDHAPSADTERHDEGRRNGGSVDPSIGRLGRTLDLLEGRLRARSEGLASESSDELERSLLGLEPAPSVDDDPGVNGAFVGELLTAAAGAGGVSRQHEISPIDSTTRLEGVSSTHALLERPVTYVRETDERRDTERNAGSRRRVALSVEREGDLGDLELPRMLWSLHRSRYTGRVDLHQGRVEKQLWLEQGELVFASSSEPEDRLVNALVRRGLLTRTQYDAARSLAAKDPRRVGQLLVEAGFLKADALPEAIRTQVLGIVTSAFVWRRGQWSLEENALCDEAVQLEESVARILVSGVLDRFDAPQLEALVGGLDGYVRLSSSARPETLALDLGLDASSQGLLTMLDGRHDLSEVCASAGLPDRVVLATVYGLLVVGAAELIGEPLAPLGASDPDALDHARLDERLELVRQADYFEVLGLSRDANAADVRRVHRELRAAFADDAVEPGVRDERGLELREIREALDDAAALLGEDDLRLAYLAHLDVP
ncbi:MAG: DUF4388 domain-containing protein [Nannocystales bacterium]